LLKNFDQSIKVLASVKARQYLWEVSIIKWKKGLVYIISQKHIFQAAIDSGKNLQDRLLESIRLMYLRSQGCCRTCNKNAKHKLSLMTLNDPTVKTSSGDEGHHRKKDIAFYIKMFPLKIHPEHDKSRPVCENLVTSGSAFEKQIPAPKCKTSVVDENIKLAEKLGITGAPP
jgi:hypothetical protein